ncbi:MAG: hypothetical protein A3E21_07430 [Sulfurimonas sp. RIFCSPHIGHO2_12_FULL_36_9]|uniref:TerB family tellurite resistance protein n=1 Tax=Sulfurimonas sp. RIFCSPLOWO2_12_36_12 TaxID=1802253 RepID=UPI0008D589C6|nr:TerB family tellurite resistance protein [Sulfurimonas sp. RIFCSPLOWO2_12_36_12]OHD96450.1 MAG: hypothetical protein A3E21_07430 [Sulfurimonas sp. RIFCSPHIGHO2_12_FULL_36_9]OHD99566.1 MAG: hypothetical protein A3J26_03165 [Sulfurimonas sp. RIFCSPLOWO2_02_FULL_36_28]OHE02401.1 MAG: hypothetical protein A2W82_10180 [Sulfurimonas sp. RIFCSPLOWO2_12_36_12]OHE07658.1 MAG: hypothetical protein A3K14_02315 [Sulfurimonas sp. RIFCSPLOWO2_12_FULL_36_74]
MGIGKILTYAGIGVGAIALAPFTGGGSVLGGATLMASLAGAGALAVGAGVVGAGAGKVLSDMDDEERAKEEAKNAELKLKAEKLEQELARAVEQFGGDKEYFNYIIGLSAMGIAMANADGEIAPEEIEELEEFIGGIASSNYPAHVKESVKNLYENKPNFNTAMTYLEKINPSNYQGIRDVLELVMLADGIEHEKEIAFIKAFDSSISMIEYKPETIDSDKTFLLEIQRKL